MSDWTPTERAQIRKYMGYSPLFQDYQSLLESAINAVRARADGGDLPDDSTQESIRAVIAKLISIEDKLQGLWCQFQVSEVGSEKLRLNFIQAVSLLKAEGRRLIHQIAIPLGTTPVRDFWSASELTEPENDVTFLWGDTAG